MMQLTDEILSEHYAHLSQKPFFQRVKDSMMTAPVIALCLQGVDAIAAVRALAGPTNGRLAAPGTIRDVVLYEFSGKHCSCFRFARNCCHRAETLLCRGRNHGMETMYFRLSVCQRMSFKKVGIAYN